MKKNLLIVYLLSTLCLSLIVDNATAQQTKKISLQGFLKDANGKAVADGQQSITFKLYTVATGGTAQWTDTQTINVFGGVYSTHLGSISNPLDNLDWGVATYFVGVTVQGVELTPRTELTFAPYSLGSPRATVADTARFVDTAKFVSCSGAVGDVKYSILNPTQFAAVNGSCWVPMDGRNIAGSKLATILGTTVIPNAGGYFFRAQEYLTSDNDPGRSATATVATPQSDDFKSHTHTLNIDYGGSHSHSFYVDKSYSNGDSGDSYYAVPWQDDNGSYGFNDPPGSTGSHSHTGTNTPTGGAETRPKNLNLYVYIRIN